MPRLTYDPANVYAYDIESMNDRDRGFYGLDPSRSYVTEVAVATDQSINGGGEVFTGTETKIFTDFARFVRSLKPGLMSGWNNTFFDNPFLDHRAAASLPNGVHDLGMTLRPEPRLRPKYAPLPTAVLDTNPHGGWTAMFEADGGLHASFDAAYAWREFAQSHDVPWSLKPVCAAVGIEMYEIDRSRLHTYTPAERRRYVLSDATGARDLTLLTLQDLAEREGKAMSSQDY